MGESLRVGWGCAVMLVDRRLRGVLVGSRRGRGGLGVKTWSCVADLVPGTVLEQVGMVRVYDGRGLAIDKFIAGSLVMVA